MGVQFRSWRGRHPLDRPPDREMHHRPPLLLASREKRETEEPVVAQTYTPQNSLRKSSDFWMAQRFNAGMKLFVSVRALQFAENLSFDFALKGRGLKPRRKC